MRKALSDHQRRQPRRPESGMVPLWRLIGPAVVMLLVVLGLPGGGCTKADTAISIGRCPSGEIAQLQITVRQRGDAIQGACPDAPVTPSYTLEKPCDTSTQFELPHLAEGQELLFWFRRGAGKTSYCETCQEGSQSNAVGKCSLNGPPPCEDKERCGNNIDDNCDGQVDENCPTEPVVEPSSEPVTEPAQEPVQEPVPEPEPRQELTQEPTKELISEPDAEPRQEPVKEPVSEDAGPGDRPDAGEAMGELTRDGEPRQESASEGQPCEGSEPGCGESPSEGSKETPGDGQTGRCTSNSDCSGSICIDSRCSTASALCSNDSMCQEHERCIKLGCHKVAALCVVDADCPNQETCDNGLCKTCSGGVCQQPVACNPADKNACSAGFSCTGKACVRQCQSGSAPRGTCPDLPRMICRIDSGHTVGICLLGCGADKECPQLYTCQIDPVTAIGYCLR